MPRRFSSGSWEFDRSGKLFSRKGNLASAQGPCPTASPGNQFAAEPPGGYNLVSPGTFSSQCSVRVDAQINASKTAVQSNDEGLVKYLSISMYDAARMYDSLKKNQDTAAAAAQKARDAEMERAKGVKPKL